MGIGLQIKPNFLKNLKIEFVFAITIWSLCLLAKIFVSKKFNSEPALLSFAIAFVALFISNSFSIFFLVGLSVLAEVYFFTEPHDAWKVPTSHELAQVTIYAAVNLVTAHVIWMQARLRNQLTKIRSQQRKWFINLSHEVRNSVYGLNELIGMYSTKPDSELLESIRFSGKNLVSLVNSIFDYSKVESKQIHLNEDLFFIKSELFKLSEIYKIRASKKNIHFTSLLDELPEVVSGDEQKILQILSNLLDNALKYTDKGEITFRASVIGSIKNQNCSVRFSITDTGHGISTNEVSQVFNPFFRSEKRKNSVVGLGLGLAISNELSNVLGGNLSFEPNLPFGTKFYFDIKLNIINNNFVFENEQETSSLNPLVSPSLRVLLVEDSIDLCITLKSRFESLGCQVCIANDGQGAIDHFSKNNFDYIFIDLNLMNESGVDVLRRLRGASEEHRINLNIIGMTASMEYIDELTHEELSQFDTVLQKTEIISDLESILSQNSRVYRSFSKNSDLINSDSFNSEVRKIFRDNKIERISALRSKAQRQDWISLGRYVHSMRSSFLAIENRHGANICLDIEKLCNLEEVDKINESVNELIFILEVQ